VLLFILEALKNGIKTDDLHIPTDVCLNEDDDTFFLDLKKQKRKRSQDSQ
jgi:hypothetical protein